MNKHSPGPWKSELSSVSYFPCVRILDPKRNEVARINHANLPENEANARLILAAADLLEGLTEPVEKLESTPQLGSLDGFGPLIRKLREIIIKATGDL